MPPGFWLYAGSARGPGGIAARGARHLGPVRVLRWHVDRLRAVAPVRLLVPVPGGHECRLVAALRARGGRPGPRGFGSSDCRHCPTHLLGFADPLRALAAAFAAARSLAAGPVGGMLVHLRRKLVLVVEEDALGGAVEILELAAAQRPQEGEESQQTHADGGGDEIEEDLHRPAFRASPAPT